MSPVGAWVFIAQCDFVASGEMLLEQQQCDKRIGLALKPLPSFQPCPGLRLAASRT